MNLPRGEERSAEREASLDENLEVGSSNPPHRTNLPATMTPDWLADDMVALAAILPTHSVLEPSAGRGAIVRAIHRRPHRSVTAIELNEGFCDELRDENCLVLRRDFLSYMPGSAFDRVVMNPPLNAVPHVLHAASLLRTGGRLVALVHVERLEEILEKLPGARVYGIPYGTFVIGTEPIDSSLIAWDKP